MLLDPAIAAFLIDSGLMAPGDPITVTPLTGGVASDIWKVETPARIVVVKQALARLRVAQEWQVPVSRNAAEVAWMIEAAACLPRAVPRILAHAPGLGAYAMTWLDPGDHPVWKQELREGRADAGFAAAVGRALATLHAATAGSTEIAARFANHDTFYAIRVEPYIEATARVHADLAQPLRALSRDLQAGRRTLIHGDISPKNILAGRNGPLFLDAECACFGEPAFDLAFCLTHLLLKCLWRPDTAPLFLAGFDALATAYLGLVRWEDPAALEARAARLLPALLLARVDGKSPVEYLTDPADRDRVRRVARRFIAVPPPRLDVIATAWTLETHP
jgi:5-methylthioribose kinase